MNKYIELDGLSQEEIEDFKFEAKENSINSFHSVEVIAEGDSWFDYPIGTDLVDCLRKHHNYKIENFGHRGDILEDLIYGTKFDRDYERTDPQIKRVLKRLKIKKPNAFLFSGGGNDFTNERLDAYLNHNGSNLSTLRFNHLETVIWSAYKTYYQDLINMVNQASPETHIFTHGYAYPFPNGKKTKFLIFEIAGPWLLPAFARKGIPHDSEGVMIMQQIIAQFNQMLSKLDEENEKFHHVDLTNLIDKESYWRDEMHLKNSSFATAAELIHQAIQKLSR